MPTIDEVIDRIEKIINSNAEANASEVTMDIDEARDILWYLTGFRDKKIKPYWR